MLYEEAFLENYFRFELHVIKDRNEPKLNSHTYFRNRLSIRIFIRIPSVVSEMKPDKESMTSIICVHIMYTVQSANSMVQFLIEKLTVAQLVRKFPALYGTRMFINVFTRVRHWSPS